MARTPMESRPQWIADAVRRGDIASAETLAQSLPEHVPAYDWEPLLALLGRLDADQDPQTSTLYALVDAAVARGMRHIPLRGAGVRMPVPD